eukprot:gene15624-15770_t
MTNQILGWIGAGKMGGPMSRRLIEAGHSVVVLDPDAANRDRARTAGAVTVESIDQMAAEASIIFAMIPNDQVLLDLVIGKGGLAETMRDGSMLIEMSTVSPAASERVSAALKARGIDYLRAPVSGSTALAANGNLSIMISGSRQAFDAVEPLLAILSTKRFYLGDGEQARYLKLAINALVGATAPLLAEALAFGRKGGLSTDSMMNVICQSAVASPLIGYKREMITLILSWIRRGLTISPS